MGINLLVADLGGEAIDTSTTMGKFMLTLFGAIAEMERGLISERTQEGMEQLKAQNKRFTESIFGWDVDVNGMLKPNWHEQDIIDWMEWQINANGMSAASVGRSLNSRGIKGKRGLTCNENRFGTISILARKQKLPFRHPRVRNSRVRTLPITPDRMGFPLLVFSLLLVPYQCHKQGNKSSLNN